MHSPNPSFQSARERLLRPLASRAAHPVSPGPPRLSSRPIFQRALQSNPAHPVRQPLAGPSFSSFRTMGSAENSLKIPGLATLVKGRNLPICARDPRLAPLPTGARMNNPTPAPRQPLATNPLSAAFARGLDYEPVRSVDQEAVAIVSTTRNAPRLVRAERPRHPNLRPEGKRSPRSDDVCEGFRGWKTGLEPATSGSTIRRSNRLSYIHHERGASSAGLPFKKSARPSVRTRQIGLEPMTYGLEGRCSIHLSYWRPPAESGRPDSNRGPPAPKAGALPGYATPRSRAQKVNRSRVRVNPDFGVFPAPRERPCRGG
jgi:hypothetical protein